MSDRPRGPVKPMKRKAFKRRMRSIHRNMRDNPEAAHMAADALLVETLRSLGYDAGCHIYDAIEKWYQ